MDGHYTISVLAFAGLLRDSIVAVELDQFEIPGAHGSSVGMVETERGYRLHPEEGGRLLKAGIVELPGHHGVEAPYGHYVRSNPNESTDDNLVDPSLIFTED